MREHLAEELLATVMDWSPSEIKKELPVLNVLARLKYDEYQQFSPGMRFVESLAYWLSQFRRAEEKRTAYRFFRNRLIYCSTAEMNHLVSVAYEDHIRPHLLRKIAAELQLSSWHLPRAASSQEFRMLERQTLFLGLSDGARTDVFRRSNSRLSNEQVRQSHELPVGRVDQLLDDLHTALDRLMPGKSSGEQRFRNIVLLDDFSASGLSYLRRNGDKLSGKIGKFLNATLDD